MKMIFVMLFLSASAQAANCPPVDGDFFIDSNPAMVRWEYTNAKKAPLLLPDLDAPQFKMLKPPQECAPVRYGKDTKRVYFQYSPVEGADAASFSAVAENYGRDSKHIYFKDQLIKDVDINSFKMNDEGFAQDDTSIFYHTERFSLAKVKRLGDGYYELGPHLLYLGREMYGADLATFRTLTKGWARDKTGVFRGDERLGQIDASTFMLLGPSFYADKVGVRSLVPVSNATDLGIPGLSEQATPVGRSPYKAALSAACKDSSGVDRCLIDERHLIAIVDIPQLGSHEIKAAPLSEVHYSESGDLQFGSEVFSHLRKLDSLEGHTSLKSLK